jgi:hypothetical protein
MDSTKQMVCKLFRNIPILILTTFINVLICFSTSGVVFIQLLSIGVSKNISLGMAILVAVGVHCYIALNHKIKNYIQ